MHHEIWELVEQCSFEEVRRVIARMSRRKCADRAGVVAEMFLYGGEAVVEHLVKFFNNIICTGLVPGEWKESFFLLLHKGGATEDANNWRPIATLRIVYKIFARLLFGRIKDTLNARPSEEQFGFRAKRSTTDALIIAESIVSKCVEFNINLWVKY